MLAEWTADCSEDSPTLVVPWADPESGLHFVDLRAEPYDISEIHEIEHYPALGRALRSLNALRSPLFTAKCDAWPLEDEEMLAGLRLELDLDDTASLHGLSGYIDILWRDRALFASAHQQQDRLDKLVRRLARLTHPHASVELTLRPAVLERETVLEGFAVTVYVTAVAADAPSALREWELALEDIVTVLRAREFEVPRTSATID
ncbi:MAG: hypothetical protein PW735_02140 [Acidobacteriaceae bacterium]|nr:hypothetical protein [Acidobacteriaceae bacterium]